MSYILYSGVNLTSLSSTYQSLSICQQALPLSRKANLLHQGKSQYSNTIITQTLMVEINEINDMTIITKGELLLHDIRSVPDID